MTNTTVQYINEPAPKPDGELAFGKHERATHAFNTVHVDRVRPRLREMYNRGYTWAEVADMIDHPEAHESWVTHAASWHTVDTKHKQVDVELAATILATPLPEETDAVRMYPILRDLLDERGACKDVPVEQFFPGKGQTVGDDARRACSDCPVKEACMEASFLSTETMAEGFYGGLPPRYRRRLRHVYREKGRDEFFLWYDRWKDTEEFAIWLRGRNHIATSAYPR